MKSQNINFLDKKIVTEALKTSFIKLRPDLLIKNLVIFFVAI